MNKLLESSSNPKQLSLSVKGALVLALPLAAVIIKAAGGQVESAELERLIDIITDIVFFSGSIASLFTMAFGLLRKIYNSF